MLRICLIIGASVLLMLGALGCNTETTVVLPDEQQTEGVFVSGTGSVFGEPDTAVLSLGVGVEEDTVAEAREEAASAMNAMLQALRDGGVQDEDIRTTRFTVNPVYDFVEGRSILRGFSVDNVVTAKIKDIESTASVIDAAIAAGGDSTRVESLQFTIDAPTELERMARIEAMTQAKLRAETLAREGGMSLGGPKSISEGGGPVPLQFEGRLTAVDAAQAVEQTPLALGELEVRVDVQVVWSMEG
jgi:hypothetical protein